MWQWEVCHWCYWNRWVFVSNRQHIPVSAFAFCADSGRLFSASASARDRQCLGLTHHGPLVVHHWNLLPVWAYGAVSLEFLCLHGSKQSHSEVRGLLPQAGRGSQTHGVHAAPMFLLLEQFSWPSHYMEHQHSHLVLFSSLSQQETSVGNQTRANTFHFHKKMPTLPYALT